MKAILWLGVAIRSKESQRKLFSKEVDGSSNSGFGEGSSTSDVHTDHHCIYTVDSELYKDLGGVGKSPQDGRFGTCQ